MKRYLNNLTFADHWTWQLAIDVFPKYSASQTTCASMLEEIFFWLASTSFFVV